MAGAFSLEPRTDSPRPAYGSPCPIQVAMMLDWAMRPHHKEVVVLYNILAPWVVHSAVFYTPGHTGWGGDFVGVVAGRD